MADDPAPTPFPGPGALGRNVVVGAGQPAPDGFPDTARLVIDDDVLAHPGPAVAWLHRRWVARGSTVIELAAGNAALQQPEVDDRAPWQLPRGFTFLRERLAFLVWANSYDARGRAPVWWDAELAVRGGAEAGDGRTCDVRVDGAPAWCDGGPRGPVADPTDPDALAQVRIDGAGLVHRETVRARRRDPDRFPLRLLDEPERPGELADDQRAAVVHAGGAARVIAPAGSGKTRVLTARLAHLRGDRHYEPALTTAVAYNTRAAQEMRARLPGLTANARTLHSLGLWIGNLADGGRRRTLLNERDQRTILDGLVRTAKIPNQDPFQPYLDALGAVRLGLVDPDTAGVNYELEGFPATFHAYRDELDRQHATDFDEQIFRAIEVLLTNPELRAHVQQVGTHLLVDEFQDLTPAFHLLIRLVASPALDVFGVGDDDQVIYGYAGADPSYLIDYAAEFPGAGDHPLQVNYRCPPPVVDQVARVLSHNRRRVNKAIRAGRTAPAATTPPAQWDAGVVVHGVDAGAMAARTVETVRDRLDAGAPPSAIAVLARVNATLLAVQVALGEAGIARTAPLDDRVMGRTGVRTALAYLRMGLDPERLRREDIFDTLNRPPRKVKSAVADLLRGPRFSLDQLQQVGASLSSAHGQRWDGYLDDLQLLTDAITRGADTARVLWLIRHAVGLGEAMDTLDSAKSQPQGSSHGDDLDALSQLAVLNPDPATFRGWLVDALRRPGDRDGVTLSTVHRVKGMEWDHVVVFAANDGLFPHRLSEDIEEERRVFHVAVTRCRETVTVVADRAMTSPFVDELVHDPTAARPAAPAPRRAPASEAPTGADPDGRGVVTVVPGLALVAPGGVPVTVRRAPATNEPEQLQVDVDGAWAPLSMQAPVTVDGRPVRLQLPAAPRVQPPGPRGGSGRLLAPGDDELTAVEQVRFDALRRWRTDQARTQQLPPYIVFNDTHLRELARRNPDTLGALSGCPGVGPKKLEQYGDDVLEVLADT